MSFLINCYFFKFFLLCTRKKKQLKKKEKNSEGSYSLSEPGFDPGTCGLWAHHASAAPL